MEFEKHGRKALRRKVIISFLVIIAVALLGYFLIYLPVILTNSSSKQWLPEEGKWYCEELQIQFCLENENETFAIIDGEKIPCSVRNNRGSSSFSIIVATRDFEDIAEVGEEIFFGKYVDRNDNEFVVLDKNTSSQVVFKRIK